LNEIWERIQRCGRELAALRGPGSDERWERVIAELGAIAQEGRRRESAREALLREVGLVLSCTAVHRVFDLIMDAVVRLSGAQRGFLLLSRADGAQEIVAARNMRRASIDDAAAEISRKIVSTVLEEDRPLRIDDALHTPPFSLAESVSRLKLLSVLCVPVRAEGRLLGALYLENRTASGVFTGAGEELIAEFADRIGVGILNAQALEDMRRSREELRDAMAGHGTFEGVVGSNPAFGKVLKTIAIAAKGDIPILIEGESGTGKELLARAVHLRSPVREGPFVSLNCAALPYALLESELFGHTRGAFTGAVRERKGVFAEAHGGTLFLDELGEMAPEVQAKLLRVLQSGEYRRVGSDGTVRANVRIVAATQRSLAEDVKDGRFRRDLFFRLNGVHVRIPPLRERKEDIPPLIDCFLDKYKSDAAPPSMEDDVRACLLAYDYPGNVRELETLIRRAVLFAREGRIGIEALPAEVAVARGQTICLPVPVPSTAQELLEARKQARQAAATEIERTFLIKALAGAAGRPGEAARSVGMNRSQFARMLSRHGLSRARRRESKP